MIDRPLPSNENIERALLGSVIWYNELLPDMEPDDFSLDSHRRIFIHLQKMIQEGKAADFLTLVDHIKGELESLGSTPIAYIASLTEGLPLRPHDLVPDYVRILKEKAALRRILLSCNHAMNLSYDESESAENIISELKANLSGVSK
jgi:replicative DNA helicase